MKMHVKKKVFQKYCRDQVKRGFINDETGRWIPINENSGMCRNMHRDCLAGYKLNRGSKRPPKAAPQVGD